MNTITQLISQNLLNTTSRFPTLIPIHSKFRFQINNPQKVHNSVKSYTKMSSDGTTAPEKETEVPAEDVIVQYVVLRRDLIDTWPTGSAVTQGCHASVAAIWENKDDPLTISYCSPSRINSMHKVTLEVKGETQLVNLSEKLKGSGVVHRVWIEQPENYPTCIATKPYPKSFVSSFFKKLKLCK